MKNTNKPSKPKQDIGNEFERKPVPKSSWKNWKNFIGVYAAEHTAGTEFLIGPLFLTTGVSAFSLLAGLALGNFFAILSWRFLTAEIAVKHRLTLYYQLERICGKKLVLAFNLANGLLFCFLSGAMITVSATAFGIPFDINMPRLTDTMPDGPTWVLIVVVVGMAISIVAAKGFKIVAKAANWTFPIIITAFVLCGVVGLKRLGIDSPNALWDVWGSGTEAFEGQIKFTFWHVFFWSWFANAAMHIGMSDLSVLRYADKPNVGWVSAAGMYIGHYVAWIAAALLYASYLKTPEALLFLKSGEAPPIAPGPMAYDAIGVLGVIAVILAGWTTANPTIYRAGLAFQSLMPKWSTYRATMVAGTLATVAGIFPAFAMKLLDYVAFYGFVLSPIGAIVAFDHFFMKKVGLISNYAEQKKIEFNFAVFFAWSLCIPSFYYISNKLDIFLSFMILPAWLTCGMLYMLFSRSLQSIQKTR